MDRPICGLRAPCSMWRSSFRMPCATSSVATRPSWRAVPLRSTPRSSSADRLKGEPPRLFRIYAEGNFIEAGDDTPFLQTGEAKYGKPIIDRVIAPTTTLADATKCILVSFDSTMRSNLSVGMPIDLVCYERDSLEIRMRRRFDAGRRVFHGAERRLERGRTQGVPGAARAGMVAPAQGGPRSLPTSPSASRDETGMRYPKRPRRSPPRRDSTQCVFLPAPRVPSPRRGVPPCPAMCGSRMLAGRLDPRAEQ